MDFKDEDFNNLMWRIHGLKSGIDLFEYIPTLKLYNEFKVELGSLNLLKIVKYIVYLYDSNTPLRSIDNFMKRKHIAGELAKFPKGDNDEFNGKYNTVANGGNKDVNSMVIRYCRIQRNPQFAKLVIYDEAYYNELETLKSGKGTPSEKKSTITNINDLGNSIESLTHSILGGDQGKMVVKQLYEEVEDAQLELTPEDIALKREAGKDPLDGYNPYA